MELSHCKTLFLDRDGVINTLLVDDYVKTWDEFEFTPDFKDTIPYFSNRFSHIFIVTNQRGVGRGLMSEQDLIDIHKRMIDEIEIIGGRIDKIYYCTANDNSNPNRKPNIGMGLQAKSDFPDINFETSLMIGDSESDMLFGKRLNMQTISTKECSLLEIKEMLSK